MSVSRQLRQVFRNNSPNQPRIGSEILVDHDILERNDLGRRHLGMRVLGWRGNGPTRFAEQRQPVAGGALNEPVGVERFAAIFGELQNHVNLFQGVEKAKPVGPHSATASRGVWERAMDPKTRTLRAPYRRAVSLISARFPVRSSSNVMTSPALTMPPCSKPHLKS